MEAFLDHMIFTCFAGVAIGAVLGGWCWLGETLVKKFWSEDKFIEFFYGSIDDEDFEDVE